MIHGVILAGGRGERFWPLSRADKPKQFLKLTSEKTMLEETIVRVSPLIPLERIKIVATESMGRHIVAAADKIDTQHLLAEPRGRNTCLAIGLAAVHLRHEDPDAIMVVLSSDHLIRPAEKLVQIIEDACLIAAADQSLITIGIVPTRPETAYGYIKIGEEFGSDVRSQVYHVAAFTEKPKAVVAQEYYFNKNYLWNSGMFVWKAEAILKAIGDCRKEIARLLDEYARSVGTPSEMEARERLYARAESISIDYAVLETAKNVLAIKADIVWDDVGSWLALQRYKEVDGENNVVIGDALLRDTFETTIYNDSPGIIAALGVSDLVIVRAGDITMVAHKAKLSDLKKLLQDIGENDDTRKYL
ncbi:MAG: mannose-1-phosphate guanylyltransferase [Candidatus Zixiibacteriota bacterium]